SIAVGTPCVTVFGKTSHIDWHPPGLEWAYYIQGLYKDDDESFSVTAEDVMKKTEDLMSKIITEKKRICKKTG
ncbi:hypothetical protein ACFLTD_04245, partial [Elusimicrobiota bacterium]